MAYFEYVCPDCGPFDSMVRADKALCGCGKMARRRFSWNNQTVLQEHYNPAFGQMVSSRAQAAELAKKASQEQSERLGMTVDYELTDLHDHEAAGITKDEMKEQAALTAEASA